MTSLKNSTFLKFSCAIWLFFFSAATLCEPIVKHVGQAQDGDQQKSYYIELLHLVVEKSTTKYGPLKLESTGVPMVAKRQLKSLDSGDLDIVWTMTTDEIEELALPIRIPLVKGLLGYRVMVIPSNKQPMMDRSLTLEDLKQLILLQGQGWADTKILKANGFKVETTDWYNTLYKSVSRGFYDYLPRSILEPWAEMRQHQFANLSIEENHLIYYPTAVYFFVRKDNLALAKRIQYGLNMAIEDGSFDQLLYQFPAHKEALNKGKMPSRIVHRLNNPYLPDTAPIAEQQLWHQLDSQPTMSGQSNRGL